MKKKSDDPELISSVDLMYYQPVEVSFSKLVMGLACVAAPFVLGFAQSSVTTSLAGLLAIWLGLVPFTAVLYSIGFALLDPDWLKGFWSRNLHRYYVMPWAEPGSLLISRRPRKGYYRLTRDMARLLPALMALRFYRKNQINSLLLTAWASNLGQYPQEIQPVLDDNFMVKLRRPK
ncbi:MAG: hypothetical protein AAB467_00045 [Patescibacteria group bacterium]